MSAPRRLPVRNRVHGASLAEKHQAIVRDQLRRSGSAMPLTLTSYDRKHWAQLGLSLVQRDAAAATLVKLGEAEYRAMRHPYLSIMGDVLCLVVRA